MNKVKARHNSYTCCKGTVVSSGIRCKAQPHANTGTATFWNRRLKTRSKSACKRIKCNKVTRD
eukprot:4092129-Amphidinium_carterae.1